jgi:hypothetical protein
MTQLSYWQQFWYRMGICRRERYCRFKHVAEGCSKATATDRLNQPGLKLRTYWFEVRHATAQLLSSRHRMIAGHKFEKYIFNYFVGLKA